MLAGEIVRTYIRGDRLAPDRDSNFSKAKLLKYWLVDEDGCPIGNPFSRRSDVELYEATIAGEYQIITGKRGRPRLHATAKEKERSRESKRNQDPDRKQYKSEWIRKRRKSHVPRSEETGLE